MAIETLEKLWALADEEGIKAHANPDYIFEPVGLLLVRPLKNGEYESSPLNSSAFANTGGDGVHFNLLHLNGKAVDNSPVVMTVPMNFGNENLILGSNLHEFLCLGAKIGYFVLEQLTYHDQKSQTLAWLNQPEDFVEQEFRDSVSSPYLAEQFQRKQYLLRVLRERLGLTPWGNVGQRLNELQQTYMPLLELRVR
jgi:hypothetical protein